MAPSWTRFLPRFLREKLEGRKLLQDVLDNTAWMMGDKILRQVVGLVVGVLLARYLGPQLFGDLSYAYAVVLILSPLAMLSLDAITIRNMAHDPDSRDRMVGTAFALMVVSGLLAYGLAMAGIFFARPEETLIHWLVAILGAGMVLQSFFAIEFWFESQLQWKFTVLGKTTAFLILNLVKILLIVMQAPLIAFAWAGLAETVAGSIGLLVVYRMRGFFPSQWRFSVKTAKELLSDSWPLILSSVFTMIYLRIDQVMLGSLVGSTALGNYSVAVRLSEAWFFIPLTICSSIFPAIVKVETTSPELFYAHMQKLYNLMVLLAYGVAIPISLFSHEIIEILFSSAYRDAGPLLTILAWTGVFTGLGAARNVYIVSKNWTRLNLISIGLGCLLNVLLNLVLIPRYEAMGAVLATFVSYWFAAHGTCLILRPLRKTFVMMNKALIYPKVW